ncbi:MAG: hypothetical protein JO232_07815 [Verrucomicrobia bacterium]|nr:hypothetical protein [Verrucomicrobiota bacterium]
MQEKRTERFGLYEQFATWMVAVVFQALFPNITAFIIKLVARLLPRMPAKDIIVIGTSTGDRSGGYRRIRSISIEILAEQSPEPIERALRQLPQIPPHSHWAYFLRNHDELDLSRLSQSERETCFRAFGPKPKMQIFQRGIRRRLAPMVGGRLELQLLLYSLIFTIPGTPILWYGEEIGMGDALGLEERNSVRTPMQWTADLNAGFSLADRSNLFRPVINKGAYAYRKVNVQALRRDPGSLLNHLERMIRTRKEYPEFGTGTYRLLETSEPNKIFAHSCQDENGNAVIAAHNLTPKPSKVTIELWEKTFDHFVHLFDQLPNEKIRNAEIHLKMPGFGFSWLRLRQRNQL